MSTANIVYAFKLSKLFVGNFEPNYKTPFKALFLYWVNKNAFSRLKSLRNGFER